MWPFPVAWQIHILVAFGGVDDIANNICLPTKPHPPSPPVASCSPPPLAGTQCMEGFIGEDALRDKAVLIGRTVLRQSEQIIIPDIKFTCSGTLTQWRFVAQRFGVSGGRNKYPELQIWRPQNRWIYNKIYSESFWPQSTGQRNVYTHTPSTPVAYQSGDVFGIYHPPRDASVYRIYSVEYGGPENFRMDRQGSARTQFDLRTSTVRTDRADYPLVGIVTS